ncbi:MAG: response regulator [Deltaproteobacteria bacterium]|nr:response regulator [Deltaproteobacteria bacterium]
MMEVTSRKYCLLVVDDEPDICDSVYDLLRLRYDVARANSAEEAMEVMRQRDVHVVMTDQRMPLVTGTEMLRKVKSDYPDAIRVLFTGYADIRSVIEAINLGHVYRYMSKPFSPEELELAVAEAASEYERIRRPGARPRSVRAQGRRPRDDALGAARAPRPVGGGERRVGASAHLPSGRAAACCDEATSEGTTRPRKDGRSCLNSWTCTLE